MQRLLAVLAALIPSLSIAQDARLNRKEIDVTIERGLDFLARDAVAWKEEHHCASCHHASLVIYSMREARKLGRTVDEPVLTELTSWLARSGNGKFTMTRPDSAPHAASPKAIYFALALATDPKPDISTLEGLRLLVATVEDEQLENGSWSAWPKTRPPMFGNSDASLTALATLALLPAAAAGDERAAVSRDKAVKWLATSAPDDELQSVTLKLALWKRLARPADEWEPLVTYIKTQQHADGGWSQMADMTSDAWATGQALYALANAGGRSNDAALARGQAFLIKTQRADGSWAMTSRPTEPGGQGSVSLIPITGAGSAWAVLGLVHSSEFATSNGQSVIDAQ